MKKKFIALALAATALLGLGAGFFLKKTSPNPTCEEVAKALYTVEDVHDIKSSLDTVAIVCEDGYFPDYISGKVLKDEFGTLLIDYTDCSVSADDEIERLRSDNSVLYAEFTGSKNVFIEDMYIADDLEIADSANGHLSYAYAQYNSDEFIEDTSFDGLIRIGVVDTGVQYDHPYLKDYVNVALGYDFVNGKPDVYDNGTYDFHSTAVTSNIIDVLAGGKTALPFEIVCYKGLESQQGTGYDISRCVYRAANDGCNIINCSFGSEGLDTLIANSIDYAVSRGVIVVCSAGNDYGKPLRYPAALTNTISVGAITEHCLISDFSNINSDYVSGGELVLSAYVGSRYEYFNGTSMSAPNLSAFIAILYANGYTDLGSIRSKLTEMSIDLGAPGRDEIYGDGLPTYTKEAPTETVPETSGMEESPSEETAPFETETEPSAVQPTETEKETPSKTPVLPKPDPETSRTETTPAPKPTETVPFETKPTAPIQPPTTSPEAPSATPETSKAETTPAPTETETTPETETEPVAPVQPAYPTGIAIAQTPDKTEYWIGDSFAAQGLKINLIYSDGTIKTLSNGYDILTPDMTTGGKKNVIIVYGNFYTTFNIQVNTPKIVISGGTFGGGSTSFTATTYPSGSKITWTSDNHNVCSIDSNGKLTAKSAGSANVTASFTLNGYTYNAKKQIKISYSPWGEWSDFRFARENTDSLRQETMLTGYFWYYFECPQCHFNSMYWNIYCPVCNSYIPFDGVCEIWSATPYSVAGNAAYGAACISGEALLRNATGGYYMGNLNNTLAYVHNSLSTQPVYRYRTRSLVIEQIK